MGVAVVVPACGCWRGVGFRICAVLSMLFGFHAGIFFCILQFSLAGDYDLI